MPLKFSKKLKLPSDQFFPVENIKTGIALHHTVGGSAESTLNWWKQDGQMVGTAYLIGNDGTIYEVFDPKFWAWQFGLKWDREKKIKFEKRFIGIEIASEGGIIKKGDYYYCFDRVTNKTRTDKSKIFDYGKDYRGYRYFDRYETAQIDSVIQLVNYLCDSFEISKNIPSNYTEYYGKKLESFEGIVGHSMVRLDKSDPAPYDKFWDRLVAECNLNLTEVDEESSGVREMNDSAIEELFKHNMNEINKMYIPAGSMIKGLLMELCKDGRDTYIKLRNAFPNGHIVYYDFVQGDKTLIGRVGMALGLKEVTQDKLEVRGG